MATNAERWARALEQELLAYILAPEPAPEKPPAPRFEAFAVTFLEMCKVNRLGANTLILYKGHLRLYLLPVLAPRHLDAVTPAHIMAIKASLSTKARNTMVEVLRTLRRLFLVAIEQGLLEREPVGLDIPTRIHKLPFAYDDSEQKALLLTRRLVAALTAIRHNGNGEHYTAQKLRYWMRQLVKQGNLP